MRNSSIACILLRLISADVEITEIGLDNVQVVENLSLTSYNEIAILF